MSITSPTFDESLAIRAAWLAHCTRTACTPSAKNEEPDRVPPVGSGLGEGIVLKPFYMAAHFTAPAGYWFTACRGRVRTFYPELVFTHLAERRA